MLGCAPFGARNNSERLAVPLLFFAVFVKKNSQRCGNRYNQLSSPTLRACHLAANIPHRYFICQIVINIICATINSIMPNGSAAIHSIKVTGGDVVERVRAMTAGLAPDTALMRSVVSHRRGGAGPMPDVGSEVVCGVIVFD
jgi:hypothetical protein